jgi:hypothetical protein
MVTFEELPCEIRYMIIDLALPDILAEASCSPASNCRAEKEFRRNVLRIATTSRSFLMVVYGTFELLDQQHFRIPGMTTKHSSHDVYRATKGLVDKWDRWYFLLRTMTSLRHVVRVPASGVTKS